MAMAVFVHHSRLQNCLMWNLPCFSSFRVNLFFDQLRNHLHLLYNVMFELIQSFVFIFGYFVFVLCFSIQMKKISVCR